MFFENRKRRSPEPSTSHDLSKRMKNGRDFQEKTDVKAEFGHNLKLEEEYFKSKELSDLKNELLESWKRLEEKNNHLIMVKKGKKALPKGLNVQQEKLKENVEELLNKINNINDSQHEQLKETTFPSDQKQMSKNLKKEYNTLIITAKKHICSIDKIKQNVIINIIKHENTVTVKRCTVRGNEYQRILQVLLRQRTLSKSGAEIGIEVSGVGQLDDVVYAQTNKNTYRFYQIKHKLHKEKEKLKVKDIFKLPTKTNIKTQKDLNLLFYFECFCKIKKSYKFKNQFIEEITFITNRDVILDQVGSEIESVFIKDSNFQEDILHFEGKEAKKYRFDVDKMKEKFQNVLIVIGCSLLQESSTERVSEWIEEYFDKIRLIVNYPDLEELRTLTFGEVFQEDVFKPLSSSKEIFGTCILYVEIKLLQISNEFTSNEMWLSEINKLKKFINGLKATAITELKVKTASAVVSLSIDLESIIDMYKDVKVLLNGKNYSVLECSGQNLQMGVVKIIRILEYLKTEKSHEKLTFLFCDYEDLFVADCLKNSFFDEDFNLLIIICKKELVNELTEELKDKLNTSVGQLKKIILISEGTNSFISALKESLGEKYCKKEYYHSFKNFSPSCKGKILNKKVIFQTKPVILKDIINVDLANKAIDENCLWEIIVQGRATIALSDDEAFCSPGYDERYYIPREFYQRIISDNKLKLWLNTKNLVFVTGECGLNEKQIREGLVRIGINEKDIQRWEENKVFQEGVILPGSKESPFIELFNEISQKASSASFWLFINKDDQLFLLDAKEKDLPANILTKQKLVKEDQMLNSEEFGDVVILVGDSAVGKSTTLTSMGRRIKAANPLVWVAKVNLRKPFLYQTLESLKKCRSPEEAIENVIKMTFMKKSENLLEKNILREGLQMSYKNQFRFVLLLDGYNEVNDVFQENITNLVQTLRRDCNVEQIWITTQNQERIKLESHLKVPSHVLKALTNQDQVKLMVQYWQFKYSTKNPPEVHDIEDLRADARDAIKEWKNLISDEEEKQFTQNSLNLKMLADVLMSTNRRIDENTKLLDLYSVFVQHKFSVYKMESAPTESSTAEDRCLHTAKDKLFESCVREILQQLSVELILNKYQNSNKNKNLEKLRETLGMDVYQKFVNRIGRNDSKLVLTKLGLLTQTESNELDFVHFSFAQFFFSEYFTTNLCQLNSDMKTFFVQHVFRASSLQPCRRFLNIALTKLENQIINIKENTKNQKQKKPRLTKAAVNILLQKTKNSSVPILENLQYVVLTLFNWLNDTDYKKYLNKILKNDLSNYRSFQEDIDGITTLLPKACKEECFKILFRLLKEMYKKKTSVYSEILNELKTKTQG